LHQSGSLAQQVSSLPEIFDFRLLTTSQVVDPHGISIDSPGGRIDVPQGTVIAVPLDPIHKDETIYPEARRYGPLRFTKPGAGRDIFEHFNPSNEGDIRAPRNATSTVSLDNAFLGFGFGRFACPGRFFALNELKLFVAHMVLNYDVECLDRRPELTDVIWLKVPYNDGRVRVRRKVARCESTN
jgi:cytochrome P450